MSKLISIITPTFNSIHTLEECILSVKSQGNFVEHIIIDGGSKDGTVELLKKYEKSYKLIWVSEKDKGITDAMNKGFAMAHGEIFSWLDADNYFQNGIINEITEIFEKNNDIDVVYGNINLIDKQGNNQGIYKPPSDISFKTALIKTSGGVPAQPGVFFKRDLYLKTGGFSLEYRVAGDIEFWMKALRENPKLYYYNQIIGSYRLEEKANSQSLSGVLDGLREMLKIYKKFHQPLYAKLLLIKKYFGGYFRIVIKKYLKK